MLTIFSATSASRSSEAGEAWLDSWQKRPDVTTADHTGRGHHGLFGALLRTSFDALALNARLTREFVEVSDSFCALTGYAREELIGRTSSALNLVSDDEVGAEVMSRLDRGLEGVYRRRLRRKDGEIRTVEFSQTLLMGNEVVLTVLRDITERERRDARLALQGAVVEAMPQAVALIRASDGIIVETNPTWDRLFGYQPGEIIGRHADVLSRLDDGAIALTGEEIRASLCGDSVWRRDVQNVRKDGTAIRCSCHLISLRHPEHGEVWVAVHVDIGAEHLGHVRTPDGRPNGLPDVDTEIIRCGPLTIDRRRAVVEHHGRRHILTRTEWLLFAAFLAHPKEVLSRERLAVLAWGDARVDRCQEVEVYVSRVRRKLESRPSHPTLIQTVRGQGYRFDPNASEPPTPTTSPGVRA